MTSIPSAPPRETYAEGLLQAFAAVRVLADLLADLGEQSTVSTRFMIDVHSEAEVDGAAALMGTTARRCSPWSYQAVRCEGTVTVVVAFTSGPAAPADIATLDSIIRSASCDIPGSAA